MACKMWQSDTYLYILCAVLVEVVIMLLYFELSVIFTLDFAGPRFSLLSGLHFRYGSLGVPALFFPLEFSSEHHIFFSLGVSIIFIVFSSRYLLVFEDGWIVSFSLA